MVLSVPPVLRDRPDVPQRAGLGVGVLVAGRPLLGGGDKERACLFGGGKQHHYLLDIVSEIVALLQCLISLGRVTAVGIDHGLCQPMMARHSLGSIVALSSDIAKWVFVTAISVAPMAALTCSGPSSNPGSAVSARGGAVVVVVVDVVVDVLVPWLLPLPHPTARRHTPATPGVPDGSSAQVFIPVPRRYHQPISTARWRYGVRLELGCDERPAQITASQRSECTI